MDARRPRAPRGSAPGPGGRRGVVHAAGWVSFGADPRGESRAVNVEATRALLDQAHAAGVRAVPLHLDALDRRRRHGGDAGRRGGPPGTSPDSARPTARPSARPSGWSWSATSPGFRTLVLCPALVIGPRDIRPTSTRLLLHMARTPVVTLPRGGHPGRRCAGRRPGTRPRPGAGRAGPAIRAGRPVPQLSRTRRAGGAGDRMPPTGRDDPRRRSSAPLSWVAGRIDHLARGRWAEVSRRDGRRGLPPAPRQRRPGRCRVRPPSSPSHRVDLRRPRRLPTVGACPLARTPPDLGSSTWSSPDRRALLSPSGTNGAGRSAGSCPRPALDANLDLLSPILADLLKCTDYLPEHFQPHRSGKWQFFS